METTYKGTAEELMKRNIEGQRARRREIARLPIGEKFRILEQLHAAAVELASIREAAKKQRSR